MSSENILELKKNRLTKAKTAIAPMRGYCVQPVPLVTMTGKGIINGKELME